MRWKVWNGEFPNSRPYLTEAVIGQGFQISSFIWLVMFLSVVGFMAWSLLPILGTTFGLGKHPYIPEKTIGESIESSGMGDIKEGITFTSPEKPYSPGLADGISSASNGEEITEQSEGVSNEHTEIKETENQSKESEKENQEEIPQQQAGEIIEGQEIGLPQISSCMDCKRYQVMGRFTHYFPNTYPAEYEKIEGSNLVTTMNCWMFNLATGQCESNMASDLPWKAFLGVAVACPMEYPMGTRVIIPLLGREYICLDRGSMVCSGGVCDFDILDESISFDGMVFETIIEVPGW